MKTIISLSFLLSSILLTAQCEYWQQEVQYDMEIDFDVDTHQFDGSQTIKYTNHSPDTLHKVFYHLYFNAFQPGSMMDVRSRTIADPDSRVGDRIYNLKENEIGYHKILSLEMNGVPQDFETVGTILEVVLNRPILPGKTVQLDMEFKSQVPLQIRRSGRDNAEGISYSMSQWYPKLAEYDYQGWHANPYVGREFHGVWGNFDVTIKIDRKYTVAAGGLLEDPEKMGHGYSEKNTKKRKLFQKKKLTWKFRAENVHDFVWAADPDYTHFSKDTEAGVRFHYFYQDNDQTRENWENLHNAMDEALSFLNENYGEYPYPIYAFIQGGDGGMEYPMATLITGERTYRSLVGVAVHEILHTWYQMLLATNESLYPWIDEGFTSFASAEVMNHLKKKNLIPGEVSDNPHFNNTRGFARWASTGNDEALTTHADHYTTNQAYGVAAYSKGAVFLSQLEYIIGETPFRSGLKRYFNEWKMKHPTPNDFIRVMEKESLLELDWYKEYWVNTTHVIDYAVDTVQMINGFSRVHLKKLGYMPMPLDIEVQLKSGETERFNIPLRIMRGHKQFEDDAVLLLEDWPWTNPDYFFNIPRDISEIESITIDPEFRMADINRDNNVITL